MLQELWYSQKHDDEQNAEVGRKVFPVPYALPDGRVVEVMNQIDGKRQIIRISSIDRVEELQGDPGIVMHFAAMPSVRTTTFDIYGFAELCLKDRLVCVDEDSPND